MAIEKQIWVNFIIANLFQNNRHLESCFRADENVVGGKIVHIPQAGAKPSVTKNRSSLPATAVKRTDTDIVYVLNEFTTDPTHIPNAEQVELSYDKLESVLGEHIEAIREVIGDEIIVQWLEASSNANAASNIAAATAIRTTGGSVGAHLPSATGNRKLMTKEDLKAARTLMNKQNIPQTDRFAIISSDLMDQLADDSDLKKRDNALELNLRTGELPTLYGFSLIERSTSAVFTNASTPVVKAVGAAAANTDNDSVVCYQRNALECALGEVDVFENIGDPQYYGDIYSGLVRMGGRKRRAGAQGVVAIAQDSAT